MKINWTEQLPAEQKSEILNICEGICQNCSENKKKFKKREATITFMKAISSFFGFNFVRIIIFFRKLALDDLFWSVDRSGKWTWWTSLWVGVVILPWFFIMVASSHSCLTTPLWHYALTHKSVWMELLHCNVLSSQRDPSSDICDCTIVAFCNYKYQRCAH